MGLPRNLRFPQDIYATIRDLAITANVIGDESQADMMGDQFYDESSMTRLAQSVGVRPMLLFEIDYVDIDDEPKTHVEAEFLIRVYCVAGYSRTHMERGTSSFDVAWGLAASVAGAQVESLAGSHSNGFLRPVRIQKEVVTESFAAHVVDILLLRSVDFSAA